MKKRFTRSLIATLAVVLTLTMAGCGKDAATTKDAVSKDTKAEITYAIWDENQRPFIEQNIAEFNKTYPGIKITVSLTPWAQYWTKLKTQAEGKNLPDVFWMNGPNLQLYADNDQLADLSNLDGVDWSNFPKALNDLYSYQGKHFGLPKDFDTIALWYNTKIFKDAGVAVPTNDWTWDDLKKAAFTISTKLKDQGIYGIATDLSNGQSGYYNTILQAGGYIVKDGKSGYGQPETIEGLKFWSDLIKDGSMPSVQTMTDNPPNKMFTAGKAAMIYGGTWNTINYKKDSANPSDLNLVELPKGKSEGTVIHGLSNVVSKSSKNLAAAKAWVAFWGTKKAAEIEGDAGVIVPAFAGTQDKFISAHPNWNVKAYTDSAKNSSFPYPVSKNTSAWADLEAEFLMPGFAGTVPMEEAAKAMASKMDEALAKESK